MKRTRRFPVWVRWTVPMTGAWLLLTIAAALSGCDGTPCCVITMPDQDFRVIEQYVCPHCPDAGVHSLFAFGFYEGGDKSKPCQCDSSDPCLMGIKMVTGPTPKTSSTFQQNPTYSNVYQNPSGGYYLPVKPANVDGSNQIKLRLIVSPEEGCTPLKQEATVEAVVDGKTVHELCLQHNDMPPSAAYWTGDVKVFGKWVTVHHIIHENPFRINVTHGGKTALNLQPQVPSNVHKGLQANGKWAFEIPDETTRKQYLNSGKALCIKVYLSCNCP
jgi:hypothetical protein